MLLTCRIPIFPPNCYLTDLDDPDFWEKAVGLQAPPDPEFDELAQLMTDGKRHRKQVQQYDPYADDKAAEQKKQERIAEIEREEEEERVVRRKFKCGHNVHNGYACGPPRINVFLFFTPDFDIYSLPPPPPPAQALPSFWNVKIRGMGKRSAKE